MKQPLAEPAPAPAPAPPAHETKPTHGDQPPSPAQVDRLIAGKPPSGIGVPPVVNVGDLALGKEAEIDVPVWNLDLANQASVSAQVTGSSALRIVKAPDHLRPSREGFDPSRTLRLGFRPEATGRVHGSVDLGMAWESGTRAAETVQIAVVGGAHSPAGPTLDDEDAIEKSDALRVKAFAARDAEHARVDRALAAEEERDTHYHEGHKRQLDNARSRAGLALSALYDSRRNGLERASAAIGTFVRAPTPEDSSLLESLALYALDLASAGIAGGIAKKLEPALKGILGTTHAVEETLLSGQVMHVGDRHVDAGPALVATITDGVKFLVKDGGHRGKQSLAGQPGQQHSDPTFDAKADFILAHQEALVGEDQVHAGDVMIRAHDVLLPMLLTDPKKAVASMDAIGAELKLERGTAALEQAHQSVLQWVRYVSQTDLGSVDAAHARAKGMATGGRESLADVSRANVPLDDHKPLAKRDGMIDISFTSDGRPETRVHVTKVRVTGVRKEVVGHLQKTQLLRLGLPVRASGFIAGPGASITITRDEAGNVAFTDTTTVPWEPATWLARKAGVMTHAARSDELRGAQKLIEEEIMQKSIDGLDVPLEIDSAE